MWPQAVRLMLGAATLSVSNSHWQAAGTLAQSDSQAAAHSHAQVHQETFGKSGCRRIVPGEYLAVDPKGRACMIGAVEKQKLVRLLIAWHLKCTGGMLARGMAMQCCSICRMSCGTIYKVACCRCMC